MTTFNGARLIGQSVDSVLAQTFTDFELIVVDDCSTDATAEVLAAYRDPRLRRVRTPHNLGIVGSRNFGFDCVRGEYVAALDHDDLSRPVRLARQVAHLDRHPEVVLVGTGSHDYEAGRLRAAGYSGVTDPELVRWMLHLANPLVYSSIMYRTAAARRLDPLVREARVYADDFDLYHRLLAHGLVARLDERLTVYRLHAGNTFRIREAEMQGNAAATLAEAYAPWFGPEEADAAARLITRIVASGEAPADSHELDRLADVLRRLRAGYLATYAPDAAAAARIQAHAQVVWQAAARRRVRAGGLGTLPHLLRRGEAAPRLAHGLATARATVMGALPGKAVLRAARQRLAGRPPAERQVTQPAHELLGARYVGTGFEAHRPPTLFVVVDTEAEFDWSKPFAHDLTQVSAMARQEAAQAIFDRHGLRPIYVVDYPVASQPEGYRPLQAILARGGCEIGAHLHPWTAPPLEEVPSEGNSYPGNLPPALEAQKLANLVAAIEASFGMAPRFYKAGRYGLGAATLRALDRHGIHVDFSLLPGADLRPRGGPDFRGLRPAPYRVEGSQVLSVPMTRAHIGALSGVAGRLAPLLRHPAVRAMKLPQVMSRLRLLDAVTLTPEGVTAAEQVALLRSLLARGHRVFVLHYHSPSLLPGSTPYVRTEADAAQFLQRIETVLRFFLGQVGGLPGNPRDLLPPRLRGFGDRAPHDETALESVS